MKAFIINVFPLPQAAKLKLVTTCSETKSELDVYGVDANLQMLLERYYKTSLEELITKDDLILDNFPKFCNLHKIRVADNQGLSYLEERVRTDELSYAVHTNRELRLMLNEFKPLSVFSRHESENMPLDSLTGGQNFTGKGFVDNVWSCGEVVYQFYALKSQVWRIDAYKTMVKSRVALGHCRQLEWIEGFLLGYTLEQNEEFLSKFYSV